MTCCEHGIGSVSFCCATDGNVRRASSLHGRNVHVQWIKTKRFISRSGSPRRLPLTDYVHQVEHLVAGIERLDQAVLEAAQLGAAQMRAVIEALQALRGIAQVTAVTIVAELGQISRFVKAGQLIGYSGLVPSEYSSGEGKWRGAITKTGNAHLRRVIVEAAWQLINSGPGWAVPLETSGRAERRSERDRLEGPASIACSLPKTAGPRKEQTADRKGGGARAARIRLGHRSERRNRNARTETSRSLGVSQRTRGGRQCGCAAESNTEMSALDFSMRQDQFRPNPGH